VVTQSITELKADGVMNEIIVIAELLFALQMMAADAFSLQTRS